MVVNKTMAAQERKWQAENDAHTLAEAKKIKADKGRSTRASREAKKMATEQQKHASALNKVAQKAAPKKEPVKRPRRKK